MISRILRIACAHTHTSSYHIIHYFACVTPNDFHALLWSSSLSSSPFWSSFFLFCANKRIHTGITHILPCGVWVSESVSGCCCSWFNLLFTISLTTFSQWMDEHDNIPGKWSKQPISNVSRVSQNLYLLPLLSLLLLLSLPAIFFFSVDICFPALYLVTTAQEKLLQVFPAFCSQIIIIIITPSLFLLKLEFPFFSPTKRSKLGMSAGKVVYPFVTPCILLLLLGVCYTNAAVAVAKSRALTHSPHHRQSGQPTAWQQKGAPSKNWLAPQSFGGEFFSKKIECVLNLSCLQVK